MGHQDMTSRACPSKTASVAAEHDTDRRDADATALPVVNDS